MKQKRKLLVFLLLLVLLIISRISFAAEKKTNSLRIALCHLDLSQGPQEKNLQKMERAIHIAGEHGAKWIVTPETALQGYYFYVLDPSQKQKIEAQPSETVRPLLNASKKYRAWLFLGAGEYDTEKDTYRNSCLVFDPAGQLAGRHAKMTAHEAFGAEVWSRNANLLNPVQVDDVSTGVLVCSDLWFLQFPRILADKGAQIIIDIAAWPPADETGNPLPAWERASERTKLPVIVCNQTGSPKWMDMSEGQSAVVENGKAKLLHSGKEAVLLFNWDPKTGKVLTEEFETVLF